MTEHDPRDDETIPTPSLWPAGFAIGVACALIGLVVSVPVLILGLLVSLVFGILWVRESARQPSAAAAAPAADDDAHPVETYGRGGFLTAATLGIGGVIGAGVTLPALGFAVLPSFVGDTVENFDVDLGPISNFPQGEYVIAT